MITSDLREVNIDDLDEYKLELANLLVEVSEGVWEKLVFDPYKDPTGFQGFLVLKNNQILVETIAFEMVEEFKEVMKKNSKILSKKATTRSEPKKKTTKSKSAHKKVEFKHKSKKGKKNDNHK